VIGDCAPSSGDAPIDVVMGDSRTPASMPPAVRSVLPSPGPVSLPDDTFAGPRFSAALRLGRWFRAATRSRGFRLRAS
jgi:hypothetical protein